MSEPKSGASGRGALAELKEAVGNLFESVVGMAPDLGFGREFPRHELRVEDDGFVVHVDVPSVRREEIDVAVSGNTVTISGKRARFDPPEGARMIRSERPSGKFSLNVKLPDEVDSLNVAARLKDGVLEVRLPKPSTPGGRNIEVEASEAEGRRPEPPSGPNVQMPWEDSSGGSRPTSRPDEPRTGGDSDV